MAELDYDEHFNLDFGWAKSSLYNYEPCHDCTYVCTKLNKIEISILGSKMLEIVRRNMEKVETIIELQIFLNYL